MPIEAAPYDPFKITYNPMQGYAVLRDRVTARKVYTPLVRGRTGHDWRLLKRGFKTAAGAADYGRIASIRCREIFGSGPNISA